MPARSDAAWPSAQSVADHGLRAVELDRVEDLACAWAPSTTTTLRCVRAPAIAQQRVLEQRTAASGASCLGEPNRRPSPAARTSPPIGCTAQV